MILSNKTTSTVKRFPRLNETYINRKLSVLHQTFIINSWTCRLCFNCYLKNNVKTAKSDGKKTSLSPGRVWKFSLKSFHKKKTNKPCRTSCKKYLTLFQFTSFGNDY